MTISCVKPTGCTEQLPLPIAWSARCLGHAARPRPPSGRPHLGALPRGVRRGAGEISGSQEQCFNGNRLALYLVICGCGSKMGTPNGTLANGKKGLNPAAP